MLSRTLRLGGLTLLLVGFGLALLLAVGLVFGWWRVMPVQSASMAPAVPNGSAVIVTPESFDDVKVGQVIIYQPPVDGASSLVHRVTAVTRDGTSLSVHTRGDANRSDDPWTAELRSAPVWHVRSVVPHAGRVVNVLRNRALRLALFPVAIGGMFLALVSTLAHLPIITEGDREADATPKTVPTMTTMTIVTAAALRANRPITLASLPTRAAPVPVVAARVGASNERPSPRPTPDWYRDPRSRYESRYFNGATWTDHVATAGVQAVDPVGAASV